MFVVLIVLFCPISMIVRDLLVRKLPLLLSILNY